MKCQPETMDATKPTKRSCGRDEDTQPGDNNQSNSDRGGASSVTPSSTPERLSPPKASADKKEPKKRYLPDHKKPDAAPTFPEKLMSMMRFADSHGSDFCVAWLDDGKSLIVRDPETFTREVVSKFFKPTKFSSFTRKLYRWGFRQLNRGIGADDPVVFGNDHFQRDNPELMAKMKSTTAAATRKAEEIAKSSTSFTQLSGNKRSAEVDQIELQQQMLLGQLLRKKSNYGNQGMMATQGNGMVSPSDSFYRGNNSLNISNHSTSSSGSGGVIPTNNTTSMSLSNMIQQGRSFTRSARGTDSLSNSLHGPNPNLSLNDSLHRPNHNLSLNDSLHSQSLNTSLHSFSGHGPTPVPPAMKNYSSMMGLNDDSSLLNQFMHNNRMNNRMNNMANMVGSTHSTASVDLLGGGSQHSLCDFRDPQGPSSFHQDFALSRSQDLGSSSAHGMPQLHPQPTSIPPLHHQTAGPPTAPSMMPQGVADPFPNAAATADIVNAAIQALKHG